MPAAQRTCVAGERVSCPEFSHMKLRFNKTGGVSRTWHWRAFVQPFSQWKKSSKSYTYWVCVCNFRYPACNAHVSYYHLWPARLHNIFPRYIFFSSSLNLLIGWHHSICNCCKPTFPSLCNCQLLCFCPLALSTAVQVFPRHFPKYCYFKDVYRKLVMPNCMPYPWVASIFKFIKVIFLPNITEREFPPRWKTVHTLNKCNLTIQVVNWVKTGIHINCTQHKFTISYEPRNQISPTENLNLIVSTPLCIYTKFSTVFTQHILLTNV